MTETSTGGESESTTEHKETVKVAIFGAGLGGLSAAWVLSAPCWERKFEVTIYEESWAPGGKAASGRTMDDTRRVDEHGLHMLFGTYHHVWWMLKHTYDATGGNGPFKTLEDAFTPRPNIAFTENVGGDWRAWRLPPWMVYRGDVRPWNFYTEPSDPALIRKVLELIRDLVPSLFHEDYVVPADWSAPATDDTLALVDRLADFVRDVQSAIERGSMKDPVWRTFGPLFDTWSDLTTAWDEARRLAEMLDLLAATLRGFVVDKLYSVPEDSPPGCSFDRINDWDLAEWLALHGSMRSTTSAVLRAFYGGLYAFPGGSEQGSLAAGVGLRAILRVLLDHEGYMVHAMNGGMGEVVIQPIVALLKARGVTFKLRHRVTSVDVDSVGVATVRLMCDPNAPGRTGAYEVDVPQGRGDPIHSYPSTITHSVGAGPAVTSHLHRENRTDWATEPVTLERGKDFHHVVLALPPSVQSTLKGGLFDTSKFATFLSSYRTVGTLGVQLWLDTSTAELGWRESMPVVGAFQRPLDTWADMTQLIQTELWGADAPKHLAFLTGARPEYSSPYNQDEVLKDAAARATRWLERDAPHLWDVRTSQPKIIEWTVSASTAPTHRYVLSMPSTIHDRIAPDNTGVVNLSVAGDWVRNGLDCGCAESAVLGGILAARHALEAHGQTVTTQYIRAAIDRTRNTPPGMPGELGGR